MACWRKTDRVFFHGKDPPDFALGLQRRYVHDLGDEAEPIPAVFTDDVFKIKQLPAMLAFEELHGRFVIVPCIVRKSVAAAVEYIAAGESFLSSKG
jgi:hypothetical protein